MANGNRNDYDKKLYESLKIDCEKCFGFCCVALYFSSSEGFPTDKEAGKSCINLKQDFKCAVHENLREKGLKGCTAYDCFGAGQRVAQITYKGCNWRNDTISAKQMFDVFLVMRQLHEMLWYLSEAQRMQEGDPIGVKINHLLHETERLTHLNAEALLSIDLYSHRESVNDLLHKASEIIRKRTPKGKGLELKRKKKIAGRLDLIGTDLRRTDLSGADLRGAILIAADLRDADLKGADLIGADLRDADIRGTDLSDSIFITQAQINSAKGNSKTKLPSSLSHPLYWDK